MTLPPYADLLGVTIEAPGPAPVLAMPFSSGVLGRPGFVHGGAIAGLLELAALVALQQALAADGGGRVKPINVSIDYMRGGRDKMTRAEGRVSRLGRRIANMTAVAWQDDPDAPIASARLNYLVERD